MNKKAEVIRVYLPPDTNCLLSGADHCLRSASIRTGCPTPSSMPYSPRAVPCVAVVAVERESLHGLMAAAGRAFAVGALVAGVLLAVSGIAMAHERLSSSAALSTPARGRTWKRRPAWRSSRSS